MEKQQPVQEFFQRFETIIENGEINKAKGMLNHIFNQEFNVLKATCANPDGRLSVPSEIYESSIKAFDKEKREVKPRQELGKVMKKLGFIPSDIIESLCNTNYNNVEELSEYMKERFA